MKNILKNIMLAGVMLFLGIPSESLAANPSGTCGTNCNWTIENGTLKITGGTNGEIGTMDNYSDYHTKTTDYSDAPWYSYKGTFRSVDISGVKNVGSTAFYHLGISSAKIGDTVTEIGSNAFHTNNLTYVELPDSIEQLHSGTFHSNPLDTVVIPDSLKELNHSEFDTSTQLVCKGENCDQIKAMFENYPLYAGTDENGDTLYDYTEVFYDGFAYAGAEQCTGIYVWENEQCHRMNEEQCNSAVDENNERKYYYDGNMCQIMPNDAANMNCASGYKLSDSACVMMMCDDYGELSVCEDSVFGCTKQVCTAGNACGRHIVLCPTAAVHCSELRRKRTFG